MFTKAELITGTIEIWARPRKFYDTEGDSPFIYELRRPYEDGEVKVATHEVSLAVPAGVNLVEAALETLKAKKTEIQAKADDEMAKVDKQIQSLRLLAAPVPEPDYSNNVWEHTDPECRHGVPLSYICTDCNNIP